MYIVYVRRTYVRSYVYQFSGRYYYCYRVSQIDVVFVCAQSKIMQHDSYISNTGITGSHSDQQF